MMCNNLIRSFAVSLLVLAMSTPLSAQDFKQILINMRKEYDQMDKVHILMRVAVFENEKVDQPYYQEKADIKRSGINYLYRFGNNDMLMNKKCMVMVDKESREIVYSLRSLKGEKASNDIFKVSIDSILHSYVPPQYLGEENGIVHYALQQEKGAIKEINLFINTTTSMLQKIEYQYRDSQHAVISFEIFDSQPTFSDDIFGEDQYVVKEKGKLKGSSAFARYSVLEAENN